MQQVFVCPDTVPLHRIAHLPTVAVFNRRLFNRMFSLRGFYIVYDRYIIYDRRLKLRVTRGTP